MPIADLPNAILFDLDGTLVDTEPYWLAAYTELAHRFGGTWTHEQALQVVGWGLTQTARTLQDAGVQLESDEIIDIITDSVLERLRVSVPWRPGARELLLQARQANLPTALVTMSTRRMAAAIADAVQFPGFDVIVAADDVTRSKPDPQGYLRAAALLGVDIAGAIAIEDSPTGLAAAVASGALSIGVPHLVPLPEPAAGDDRWTLWSTLAGRTLDDIRQLATRRAHATQEVPR